MHIKWIVLHVIVTFKPNLVRFYLLQTSSSPVKIIDPLALGEVACGEAEVRMRDDFKGRIFSVNFPVPVRVGVEENISWIPSIVRIIYDVDILVVSKADYQNKISRRRIKH